MPAQDKEAPKAKGPGTVTVESNTATSPEPGATAPTHDEGSLSRSTLSDLKIDAAESGKEAAPAPESKTMSFAKRLFSRVLSDLLEFIFKAGD
jgi:hypothetical protein